jgi:hypothetical protein
MSAVWPWRHGGVADGTGPDGVGPVSVVPVGARVTGAVVAVPTLGLSVGVAVGLTVGTAAVVVLDGTVTCGVGGRDGTWDALRVGVLWGVGVFAGGDDGVPAVGTAAKSPCS